MKKIYKKVLACIMLVAFVLTIPVTTFANTNVSVKEKITITAFENNDGMYYIETENSNGRGYSLQNTEQLTAVLDDELGLYKVQNVNNLYLKEMQNGLYIPIEKSSIKDVQELEFVTNKYELTEAQYDDLESILNEYPEADLNVYAPKSSNTVYGTTNDGKQYRFVIVTAHDDEYSKTIAEGPDILG